MALSEGKHGVIVIHGVEDEARRGEFLAKFANSLADALLESPVLDKAEPVYPEIQREADLSANPASVTLKIKAPKETAEATWICKEAFWADAFPPPAPSSVLRWAFKSGKGQLMHILKALWKDPANQKTFKPAKDDQGEGHLFKAGFWVSAIYRVQLTVMSVLFTIFALLFVSFFKYVLWPLYWLPRFGKQAKMVHDLLHKADAFLSNVLGDVKRYTEHGVWSANIRRILEDIIIDMFKGEGEYKGLKDVTIVAHSMGGIVAYDTLIKDGRVAQKLKELGQGERRKITFISVGSPIKMVLEFAKNSNITYTKRHFKQPLDEQITTHSDFFWLDIYARLDPLPILRVDEKVLKDAGVKKSQFKARQVVNMDNIFRDHTYYWKNKNLVMPRIARYINRGKDPWDEAGITEKKLNRHYNAVAYLSLLRLAMIPILVGSAVILFLSFIGQLDIPQWVPLIIAALAVSIYQSIRSWKFGDIS